MSGAGIGATRGGGELTQSAPFKTHSRSSIGGECNGGMKPQCGVVVVV